MPNDRILKHLMSFNTTPSILQLVEKLEKKKGWKMQERVPSAKKDALACCQQMRQAPGTPLTIVFEESPLQQSTDDMEDSNKQASPQHRALTEGKRDIIVHIHFEQPAAVLGVDKMDNTILGAGEGFLPTGELPQDLRTDLFGADGKKTQSGLIVPKLTKRG